MAHCVLDSCVLVSLTRKALFTGMAPPILVYRAGVNFHACVYTQVCTKARIYSRMHAHTHACIHARMPPAITSRLQCITHTCVYACELGVGLDWCALNRVLGAAMVDAWADYSCFTTYYSYSPEISHIPIT